MSETRHPEAWEGFYQITVDFKARNHMTNLELILMLLNLYGFQRK